MGPADTVAEQPHTCPRATTRSKLEIRGIPKVDILSINPAVRLILLVNRQSSLSI